MAPSAPAPFYNWPWQRIGSYKYLLYLPFAAMAFNSWKLPFLQNFGLQMLLLALARNTVYQFWLSYSRFLPLSDGHQIRPDGLSYAQVDREWHCDNHYILHAYLLFAARAWLGFMSEAAAWKWSATAIMMALHVGPAEFLYYWIHRAFHTDFLFSRYHKLHHESVTPEPSTPGSSTFLEQVILSMIMAVPIIGGSSAVFPVYLYILGFDFLRAYGHSNTELVPAKLYHRVPLLKYLIYTPSYHTLHHEQLDSNYCLFMPLYDHLGGTVNSQTESFHAQINEDGTKKIRVPDYVFLLHAVDFMSGLHAPFVFRAFSSYGYRPNLSLLPVWPSVPIVAMCMWIWGTAFKGWNYYIGDRFHQIWLIPRFGFMYFLPFTHRNINKLIENAILEADKMGVKVLSLAALNKNEALNGGGILFVKKHPELKVRVCHGNTLTAAVIIKEIPPHVTEVFLTGATSKLGRAIALYLSRKGVRVLMLTESRKRFENIAVEALPEHRQNLVQVTKHQAGKNCQTWILGKWTSYSEQMMAPPGTHFHQFVVPPVIPFRKDCTYGGLAAMKLPSHVRGLACCEYTLDRNVVHACHAGGVVHALEGWTHHEVGALDVERIDTVWEAAMKHGLSPAY